MQLDLHLLHAESRGIFLRVSLSRNNTQDFIILLKFWCHEIMRLSQIRVINKVHTRLAKAQRPRDAIPTTQWINSSHVVESSRPFSRTACDISTRKRRSERREFIHADDPWIFRISRRSHERTASHGHTHTYTHRHSCIMRFIEIHRP